MSPTSSRPLKTRLARRARPYLPYLAASSILAWLAIRNIFADAQGPAVPLDDSYIHFVYAKRFAEFSPFVFSPGDGPTSGATSFLWPILLAPFWLLGLRDDSIIWAAWLLGTLLHAATALETKRLAEKLAGPIAGIGASVMCLLFGAFAWFAWSGMETMGLAWAMTRACRTLADLAETEPEERSRSLVMKAAFAAALCPLFRPEGGFNALVSIVGIALLTWRGPAPTFLARARGLASPLALPLAAIAVSPLLNLLITGSARSTTTMVKWGPGNPYYIDGRLTDFLLGNVGMFFKDLLSAGPFTTEFLPDYTHWVFAAGLVAFVTLSVRTGKTRIAIIFALFLVSSLIPCSFITILWNRVRYIWPYAPSWFVLVACLGHELAYLAKRVWKTDTAWVAGVVTGVFAGALATKMTWSLNDLANSSRAIKEQQVKLGRWAKDNLPSDARIGLNDTGAIAYFSERRTFDVVGLTTQGEALYWVHGAGSRFEHYEKLGAANLPTHFIVYPEWFGIPSVLGPQLFAATVQNQSILGGATKVAYEADWSVLGRATLPMSEGRPSPIADVLDVADVESEREHRYELTSFASENDNRVGLAWNDEGEEWADGGRSRRVYESFMLDFTNTTSPVLVVRASAPEAIRVNVEMDDATIGEVVVPGGAWSEISLPLPKADGLHRITLKAAPGQMLELRGLGQNGELLAPEPKTFGTMHYWLFAE